MNGIFEEIDAKMEAPKSDAEALRDALMAEDTSRAGECEELGIHPETYPMGDDHHTDSEITSEDLRRANLLGWYLGSLFADVNDKDSPYWYYERTSINEWARVARALRIHGLEIRDVNHVKVAVGPAQ